MFPFNQGIPAAGNKPSDDQPEMLSNNVSSYNILGVDHYSYSNNLGGQHLKLTFPNVTNQTSTTLTGLQSIAYTALGIQNPARPQMFYKNQQGTFPLTAIRAFGAFSINLSGAPTVKYKYNVNTITSSPGTNPTSAVVTLNTNAVDSAAVVVLLNCESSSAVYSYTSSWAGGVLTITITFAAQTSYTSYRFNFSVLQI